MKKRISIITDNSVLYSALNADTPNGVKIISKPPIEQRGDGLHYYQFVINIDIVVDVAKILPYVFAAWLIKRSKILEGKHNVNINNKQIPVDDPEAIELIAKEIEDKK